jgi:hypothetical protein
VILAMGPKSTLSQDDHPDRMVVGVVGLTALT